MAELPSGTVTFLFTDIEGSTTRWEHQPETMGVALARHDALVRAAIHDHDGHVVKTMGDAVHAVFVRAPDAVATALDAQRRLQAEPWGETGPLRVRMALHTGAAEERDGDYYGPALNQGITPEEITEAFTHLIAYCGFPAGLTALEIANEVIGARK